MFYRSSAVDDRLGIMMWPSYPILFTTRSSVFARRETGTQSGRPIQTLLRATGPLGIAEDRMGDSHRDFGSDW
jgi:hypothetical protein